MRLPKKELNNSTADQRIANSAIPISADTCIGQHNDSSSVALLLLHCIVH